MSVAGSRWLPDAGWLKGRVLKQRQDSPGTRPRSQAQEHLPIPAHQPTSHCADQLPTAVQTDKSSSKLATGRPGRQGKHRITSLNVLKRNFAKLQGSEAMQ